ncbi:UNKNOWN [Stylonychia lemnae]|uniref:Uncharacterized protein n=1 Tax=Stylonychia lemnae TaxID=5949 RepID=A0A078ATA2_STYLE|nr:UNKNOWN [Stylonychia lemnae]|eukprot:CDW84397.1 UNKNOWN [Stylonychia lemnae]
MNTDRGERESADFDPLLFSRLVKSGHKKMRSMSSPLLISKDREPVRSENNSTKKKMKVEVDPEQEEKDYIYWPEDTMPKFFPLSSLGFGIWKSQLHQKDQLFVMVLGSKFIFVVVHPPKQKKFSQKQPNLTQSPFYLSDEDEEDMQDLYYDSFYLLNKRKILKYFGNKNPFTTTELKGGKQEVDFYGVVAFEVESKEIIGMTYTNNLVKDANRIVFEARTIIKKSFENVEDFFSFYGLDKDEEQAQKLSPDDDFYIPRLNYYKHKIDIKRVFPFNKNNNNQRRGKSSQKNLFETKKEFINRVYYQTQKSASKKSKRDTRKSENSQYFQSSRTLRPEQQNQSKRGQDFLAPNYGHRSIRHSESQLHGDNTCFMSTAAGECQTSLDPFKVTEENLADLSFDNLPLQVNENLDVKSINIAYFDDPILPYALREVVNKKQNRALFLMHEAPIPQWTVLLAQFGYYKPWIRIIVKYLVYIISIFTMILGFWDLYKNVPVINSFIHNHLNSLQQLFEDHVTIRLSILLVKLIFYMPTMSILKILLLIKDGFIGIYLIIKEIIIGISAIKKVIIPAAKTVSENKETTLSIIQFFQAIGFSYSQSLYRKMVLGCKTIYDFFIFLVSPDIYKYLRDFFWASVYFCYRFFRKCKSIFMQYRHILLLIFQYTLRYVCLILFLRILYIATREYFEIEGCIFCTEFKDKTSHYLSHFVERDLHRYLESEQFINMLNNYHKFVDWIANIQSIDLQGIEL